MPGAVTSSDHNFRTLLLGSKSRSEYKWALPANIVFDRVLHGIIVRSNVRKDLLFLARATKSTYRASSPETALTAVAESILLIPISPGRRFIGRHARFRNTLYASTRISVYAVSKLQIGCTGSQKCTPR